MQARFRGRLVVLLAGLSVALAGCASSGGSPATRRGAANRIGEDELVDLASLDLYTVIQRLRPQWLQQRAPVTGQGRQLITIIVDGVRQQGTPEQLRSLRTGDVQEVRYLNARDATTRYGTDMTAGAIEVITKR